MLAYAGRAHAKILDAIEHTLPVQDDCMPVNALRDELAVIAAPRQEQPRNLAGYFPGWHGVTELGF